MIALLLLACTRQAPDDTGPTLDTGWFVDTGGPVTCADRVQYTSPVADTTDWYHRDAPIVRTGTRAQDAYTGVIVDADGVPVPTTVVWSDDAPEFSVVPDAPLAPSTTYGLVVTDCEGLRFVPFGTSDLGEPLIDGPAGLVDAAFAIQLREATFLEPAGLGSLIALYLDWPVLLGVQFANDDIIDLIGAQGYIASSGTPRQLLDEPTWDYPLAPFTSAPYVEANAPQIEIAASNAVNLTIYDFRLQGTFSPDGAQLGGARIGGFADTRNLGAALDLGDSETAVCDAAAQLAVGCVACPDGEPLCIEILAVGVTGERIPGVSLVRVP